MILLAASNSHAYHHQVTQVTPLRKDMLMDRPFVMHTMSVSWQNRRCRE